MKRNMGTPDRIVRATIVAPLAVFLAAAAGWTTVWALVGLAVAGVMLLTAAIGFCPLYALVGIDTTRRRRRVAA